MPTTPTALADLDILGHLRQAAEAAEAAKPPRKERRPRTHIGLIDGRALLRAPARARATLAYLTTRADSEGRVSVPLVCKEGKPHHPEGECCLSRALGRHPVTIATHIRLAMLAGCLVTLSRGYLGHTAVYQLRHLMTPEEWLAATKRRFASAMASRRRRNEAAQRRREEAAWRKGAGRSMLSPSAKPPSPKGVGAPPEGGRRAAEPPTATPSEPVFASGWRRGEGAAARKERRAREKAAQLTASRNR